jgi:hypothetical protein
VETGFESYQAEAIIALAEVIKIIKEDMHPTYMELCVQVALTLLKRDHDDDVTPAALYLLAIICIAGRSKAAFGRTFVTGEIPSCCSRPCQIHRAMKPSMSSWQLTVNRNWGR